jgi:UDP-GlcNAc:undecaprenyl-phosphate/decaprenyl-phosphate GlcNAc-1-phosphate transferase
MIALEILAGALAFFLTIAFVPVVRALCSRWRLFDAPGPLKIHSRPIPRLGGVAIALAIVAAVFFSGPHGAMHAWPFFAALALVWAAGLADDLRPVSPWARLAAQFAAGALLWQHGWRLPILGGGALNLAATAFFVAGFANSANLLDGMDGLAAGIVGIIAAAYLALPGALMNPFAVAVAWGLAGACVGFLPYNRHPARLHMGDSGSLALGFCVAFLGLNLYRPHTTTRSILFFPLLSAALPLLDAVLAMVRRLRSRSSPFSGDRFHFYDLLSARGWSVRRIVLTLYGVTAALAAIGLCGVRSESPRFWAVAAISVGLLLYAAIRLGSLRGNSRDETARRHSAPMTKEEYGEPWQTD